MLACQHCGASLEGYNDVVQETQHEICDDKAIITTDYRCPICLGWTRGTQIGYITDWQCEQLEAI